VNDNQGQAGETADDQLARQVVADLVQAGLIGADVGKKLLAKIKAGRITSQDWSGFFELARPSPEPGGLR
jgi:hypothetical protein